MKSLELHPKTDEKWNCTLRYQDDSTRQKYRISSLSIKAEEYIRLVNQSLKSRLLQCPISSMKLTGIFNQALIYVLKKYSGSVSELLAPVAWGDSHTAHTRQEQWLLTRSHQAKTLHMDELQMGHFITTESLNVFFSRHWEHLVNYWTEFKITFPLPHSAHLRISSLHRN